MPTDSRHILAVGIFGGKSHIGDRIEFLLHRKRAFSSTASAHTIAAGALSLTVLLLAASFAPRWIAFAQTPPGGASFDVASVHQNRGRSLLMHIQPSPGGRLTIENVSLRFLLQQAFSVRDSQMVGGPAWLKTDRFDIEATSARNPDGRQMLGPMLRTLLEDRFHLAVHRETRQLPIYALTIAKNGSKLIAASEGACIQSPLTALRPLSSPFTTHGQKPACGFLGLNPAGSLDMLAARMDELTASLSMATGYTVVDRTGLSGAFDVHLRWTPERRPATLEPTADSDPSGTSLFTAVQEQLGLKLESAKGPVEVLVIDHVERPTEN